MSTPSTRSTRNAKPKQAADSENNESEIPAKTPKSPRRDKSPKGAALKDDVAQKEESTVRTRRSSAVKESDNVQSISSPRSPGRARGTKASNAETGTENMSSKEKQVGKNVEIKGKDQGAAGGIKQENMTSPSTPSSGIRRSSRAPVPSSKFKDMEIELGSSRKRSSLASSVSEGSDAEYEPAKKRSRKTSEKSQAGTVSILGQSVEVSAAEVPTESATSADESEHEKGSLSIQEMIQTNLNEAGLGKEITDNAQMTGDEESHSSVQAVSETAVESQTPNESATAGLVQTVPAQRTVSTLPLMGIGGQPLMIANRDGRTLAMLSMAAETQSSVPIEQSSEDPNISESSTSQDTAVTQEGDSAKGDLSKYVTVSPTAHGLVHGHVVKSVDAPFATVVQNDGATYLNLNVEATNISTILKGKNLATSQKPSSRGQGHGRVLRNPAGNLIVKTSLLPPTASTAQSTVKEETKPAVSYSLLQASRSQQQDAEPRSPPGSAALSGAIKSSVQGGQMPQRVVIVRQQPANRSGDGAKLSETSPTVIRFPQDLPSKKSSPTVVHISTLGSIAGDTKNTGSPRTASELLQQLKEQQKRVIVKEAVGTADAAVKEALSRSDTGNSEQGQIVNTGDETGAIDSQEIESSTVIVSESADKMQQPTEQAEVTVEEVTLEGTSDQVQAKETRSMGMNSSTVIISDGTITSHVMNQIEQVQDSDKNKDDQPLDVQIVSTTEASYVELQNVDLDGMKDNISTATVHIPAEPGKVITTTSGSHTLQVGTGVKDKEKVIEKIRIVDNGVEYDVSIVAEEDVAEEIVDNSTGLQQQNVSQEVSTVTEVGSEIAIKQEVLDEDTDVKPDIRKQTSGTQTVYSPRLQTGEVTGTTTAVTHKLATVVDDGQEKKHVYYVSVIPNKGIMAKTRTSVYNAANWVMGENGMFCCEKCNYETDRKANFYKHRRSHTGFKPHVCPVCQYKAGTSSNLKRHMGIHKDIREHKCDICGLCFRQKIHLERHIKYKHEEKSIKCPMCDYICANEQPDLKMHIKRKHSTDSSGEVLSCPECKVRVGNRKDLKQHMKFHKDGPELKLFCKECSFVTDCQSRLKRHTAIHSKMKPFQCGVCNYRAAQKEHVLRHLRTQHKIEVKKDKKRPWKRHKKSDSDDGMKERADFSSGDKIFACNHCTMRFAKLINLYKHLHAQHSDIMPPETDGNYYCVVCEYSTTSKKNLLVHMRRHNMADQTPPTHVYSCVLCRYVNPKRRNLFQHMRKKHNINISKQTENYLEGDEDGESQEMEVSDVISSVNKALAPGANSSSTSLATVEATEAGKEQTGDLAGVANMIKIEDLTRTSTSDDVQDIQNLVIDNRGTEMAETVTRTAAHNADALEGLQALAEQAGLIDNIIEEQVPIIDEQQTIVIEQGGTAGEVVGNVEVVGGQFQQVIQTVEETQVGNSGETTGVELTEEQLSSLKTGDMVEMEGELYLVEMTQDPSNPDKQLLSFLPVTTAPVSQEAQS